MFEESAEAAWELRFGSAPPELPDLDRFLNHRSVRKYTDQPIDENVVAGLLAAAQSASTSSNLQLWSVVSIQDKDRRQEISQLCGDQQQVRDAAWFFAFLVDHARLYSAAKAVGESGEGLDFNEFYTMAVIDAALAAERLVCAAEAVGIGACYIGALRNDPYAVAKLLHLPQRTFGVFGLCLGWPDDSAKAEMKPRLSQDAIWFRETYNPHPDMAEYDERMTKFYESQNMKGDVTWSMRSARRVDGKHMTGREVLKTFLATQELDIR